eukprot:scaffold202411_cov17-Prasinocladus_malaysianus.AAC.1
MAQNASPPTVSSDKDASFNNNRRNVSKQCTRKLYLTNEPPRSRRPTDRDRKIRSSLIEGCVIPDRHCRLAQQILPGRYVFKHGYRRGHSHRPGEKPLQHLFGPQRMHVPAKSEALPVPQVSGDPP